MLELNKNNILNVKKHIRCYLDNYDKSSKLSESIPTELYKYTSLNHYTLKNLNDKKITLTAPSLFNDPYDSLLNTRIDTEFPAFSHISKLQQAKTRKYLKNHKINKNSPYRKLPQDVLRVASLTTKNNNLLMWGHYGDSNCGICIDFDMEEYPLDRYIFPVIYVNKMTNIFRNTDIGDLNLKKKIDQEKASSILISASMIKDNRWNYEDEWRIIRSDGIAGCPQRIYKQSPEVDKIYLGPKFIQHWLNINSDYKLHLHGSTWLKDDKKQLNLFYKFCKIVKQNEIHLVIMKPSTDTYKCIPYKSINVDQLKTLDFSKLQKYLGK